jgi:hypothetical protein
MRKKQKTLADTLALSRLKFCQCVRANALGGQKWGIAGAVTSLPPPDLSLVCVFGFFVRFLLSSFFPPALAART